jgi:hypothetical protein
MGTRKLNFVYNFTRRGVKPFLHPALAESIGQFVVASRRPPQPNQNMKAEPNEQTDHRQD